MVRSLEPYLLGSVLVTGRSEVLKRKGTLMPLPGNLTIVTRLPRFALNDLG